MQRPRLFYCISFLVLVFLFLIFPPLTVSEGQAGVFLKWTFPFRQMILCFSCVLILLLYKKMFPDDELKDETKAEHKTCKQPIEEKKDNQERKKSVKVKTVMLSSYFLFTFGLLWIFQVFFQILSKVFGKTIQQEILKPHGFEWIFCVLNFLFSAASEEILYRFIFPECLCYFSNLLKNERRKKISVIISEIVPALVFAFSHRYLGIFAVFNAFFAHIVLRLCFKKTGKIYICIASHFLYNFLSLVFLSLL